MDAAPYHGVNAVSSRFQPGEGPSRGLLHDCIITSPINRLQHYSANIGGWIQGHRKMEK